MRVFGEERAVSDVLAFIIVFSIIITSVALVYNTGFSSLDTVRESERNANAARAFEAIALSMDDIAEQSAPVRVGSLELSGGLLQVDEPGPTIEVEVDGSEVFQEDTGSFVYSREDTEVAYENGGVFRSDRGNSVLVRRASMSCSTSSGTDHAVISVVVVQPGPDTNPLDTEGDVEFELESERQELAYADSFNDRDVSVDISNTGFDAGWSESMTEQGWTDTGGGEYTCDNVDQVVVRVTVVTVKYPVN